MSDDGTKSVDETMSAEELRSRVLFSLLMPAARLALSSGVPLKEMKRLIELALYQESRRRKLKMREIRKLMAISMSKVGLLSKDLKAHYAQPDQDHGVPRRILTLLWSGPLSVPKLASALDEEEATVRAAISKLLADKRIVAEEGRTVTRYALGLPQHRLVQAPWMVRVDALNNLVTSLIQTVESRFFEGDRRAFARTLHFRAREEDIARLQAHYESLFELVCELDEAATGEDAGRTVPLQLSLLWTPDGDFPQTDEDDDSET